MKSASVHAPRSDSLWAVETSGGSATVALVAHQRAEVTVVILELLFEEGDGGRSIEDDPRLGGRRALAAAV